MVAEVVVYSCKPDLAGTVRHLLEPRDLRECLSGCCGGTLYVDAFFNDKQAWRKEQRDELAKEGRYHLIGLSYRPVQFQRAADADRNLLMQECKPWAKVESPVVVDANLYPVEHELALRWGLESERLTVVLQDELKRLLPGPLPCRAWWLQLDLLTGPGSLESTSSYDDGHAKKRRIAWASEAEPT